MPKAGTHPRSRPAVPQSCPCFLQTRLLPHLPLPFQCRRRRRTLQMVTDVPTKSHFHPSSCERDHFKPQNFQMECSSKAQQRFCRGLNLFFPLTAPAVHSPLAQFSHGQTGKAANARADGNMPSHGGQKQAQKPSLHLPDLFSSNKSTAEMRNVCAT